MAQDAKWEGKVKARVGCIGVWCEVGLISNFFFSSQILKHTSNKSFDWEKVGACMLITRRRGKRVCGFCWRKLEENSTCEGEGCEEGDANIELLEWCMLIKLSCWWKVLTIEGGEIEVILWILRGGSQHRTKHGPMQGSSFNSLWIPLQHSSLMFKVDISPSLSYLVCVIYGGVFHVD